MNINSLLGLFEEKMLLRSIQIMMGDNECTLVKAIIYLEMECN